MTPVALRPPWLTWRTALLSAPLLLVIFMGTTSTENFRSHSQRINESDSIFALLAGANQLFSELEGAESAKRGYLLTRNRNFLERYRGLTGQIQRNFEEVRQLADTIPNGPDRLARLKVLGDAKIAEMDKTLQLFESQGLAAAIPLMEADNDTHHMDQIRQELAATIEEATRARQTRRDVSLLQAKRTNLIIGLGSTALFLLLAFATFMIERDQQIQRRYLSRIRDLNHTLEEKVKDRTKALEETNRELEAFCYSVSHDLRAPLRAVDGFAKILNRDYAGKVLDQRAKDLMARMCASTVRMGQLIDDLLNLSRISRGGIQPAEFDLSALAGTVAEALRAQQPGRNVEVRIEPGLKVWGDPRLLRVALENLFGNAWKFSRDRSPARIQFGRSPDGSYFVKDNGVGFDMDHAGLLFAPFQRLHRDSEFEGTGIGLATVERVIHSHGGRIWAESRPDLGATFHFTIETERRSSFAQGSTDFVGRGQPGRRAAHA